MRPHFLALSAPEWQSLFQTWNEPKYRADQVHQWVVKKGAKTPFDMTNVSKKLQGQLLEHVDWTLPEITDKMESEDGTTKLLLRNAKGQSIETVIMRYENRTTICVSSQVGCKLACSFCQTGKLGFFSHLGVHEILAQYALAQQYLNDRNEARRISHVVFMGMGEPLDNYENSVTAGNRLIDPLEYGLSNRHVTLSTSGMVPRILQLPKDFKGALAVSLHASRDELRTELMPINRKYDLASLKAALMQYQKETERKITIEYILIRDKNCGQREAKELVSFLHGLQAKVNLIPFNDHPGSPYGRPAAEDIRAFQKYLSDRSYPAPVRYSKGLDVSAACGQLAAKVAETLHQIPQRKAVLLAPSAVSAAAAMTSSAVAASPEFSLS